MKQENDLYDYIINHISTEDREYLLCYYTMEKKFSVTRAEIDEIIDGLVGAGIVRKVQPFKLEFYLIIN